MNILDSNILIYSSQSKYAYLRTLIFDKQNCISKITELEVLGFHRLNNTDKKYFLACFQFLKSIEVSNEIVDHAIILRQQQKMSLGDAIIAATALNYEAAILTRNVDDFARINGLKVINPIQSES